MQREAPSTATETSLETVRIDFMEAAHDLHQQQSESKKKEKAGKRFAARRAIETYQEQKQLEASLREWWQEI